MEKNGVFDVALQYMYSAAHPVRRALKTMWWFFCEAECPSTAPIWDFLKVRPHHFLNDALPHLQGIYF